MINVRLGGERPSLLLLHRHARTRLWRQRGRRVVGTPLDGGHFIAEEPSHGTGDTLLSLLEGGDRR